MKLEGQKFEKLEWEYVPKTIQEDPPAYEASISQASHHGSTESIAGTVGRRSSTSVSLSRLHKSCFQPFAAS